MPDVGVLQLSIKDNSKTAGSGLEKLAGALDTVRQKAGEGLGLGKIVQEVQGLAKTVNEAAGTSTLIKNLTAFGNAMDKLSHIKNALSFDTKPLETLKTAIGEGFSIKGNPAGQIERIRDALTKDWGEGAGTSIGAMKDLKDVADGFAAGNTAATLKDVASAVTSYATAAKKLQGVNRESAGVPISESVTAIGNAIRGATESGAFQDIGLNIANGIRDGLISGSGELAETARSVVHQLIEEMKNEAETHSPSRKGDKLGRQINAGVKNGIDATKEEVVKAGDDMIRELLESMRSASSMFDSFDQFGKTEAFERVASTAQKLNEVDVFGKTSQSAAELKGQALDALSTIELLRTKLELLHKDITRTWAFLAQHGEDPLQNTDLVNMLLQANKLSEKIRDLTDFNAHATKASSNGANMVVKYRSMIDTVTKAYDAGKLSEEKFAAAIIRIQEYGEKVKKAGGAIDEEANEITRRVNAMFDALERPVDYTYLRDAVDVMTGVAKQSMTPQEWGVDAFVTEASMQISTLIETLERPIDYSSLREAIDFMQGIGSRRLSLEEWGVNAFETEASKQIEALKSSLERPIDYKNLREVVDEINGIGRATTSAKESMIAFLDAMQGDSDVATRLRIENGELAELSDMCVKAGVDFRDLESIENMTADATIDLGSAFASLKTGIKNMFPTISGLIKRFTSIAKMRAIRYVIRQITSGISEGIKNVYYYSKAINGDFAPAMDSASSAIAQMKNSIGAALAPVLQALIPVLRTIVNWFITMINYLNQFFALLNGQTTWTQAVEQQTQAYSDNANAANNASKAAKDLLADWDELNIIQSNSGGNGGGGGVNTNTPDYSSMFQQVNEFSEKIKTLVDGIKKTFGSVWNLVKKIAATILAWKVSEAFGGIIGVLGTILGAAGVIDLSVRLTDMFGKSFVQTGDPAWFILDALTGAVGPYLAGKIVGKLLGASWAKVTAGFTLMLEGDTNLKNSRSAAAQKKQAEYQMLAILGSVEEGIGAALIAAGFEASLPVAAAIGGAVAVYSYVTNALAAVNITGIKWGTETLSEEDIQTFVKNEMLAVDIPAQIEITHAKIELAKGESEKLQKQATALLVPVKMIKTGVDIDSSLAQIKDDVFGEEGLIAQFKRFTASQEELVNTAETYAPTIGENGENLSEEIIADSHSAWAELNSLMDGLGSDLSMHLTRAMDTTLSEELRAFEMKAVDEITDTMIRVSLAGQRATHTSDALTDLTFNLEKTASGTFEDIIAVYDEYKKQLTEENMQLKKEEAASFARAAAQYNVYAEDALERAGGDETDEKYQYYLSKAKKFTDEYDRIMANLPQSVQTSVELAIAPGAELTRKALINMLGEAEDVINGSYKMFSGGQIRGLPVGLAGGIKDKTQLGIQGLLTAGINEGITDQNRDALVSKYKEFLGGVIQDLFPDDYGFIQQMLDMGLIKYDDVFDFESLFKSMEAFGYNTDVYRELLDLLTPDRYIEVEVDLDVEPDFTIDEDAKNKLKEALEYYLDDDILTPAEERELIKRFTQPALEQVLEELGYSIDNYGNVTKVGDTGSLKVANPLLANARASAGVSDVGYSKPAGIGTSATEAEGVDYTKMADSVKAGANEANTDTVSELRTIVMQLTRLLNKEWVVNIQPSSSMGRNNSKSNEQLGRVTG